MNSFPESESDLVARLHDRHSFQQWREERQQADNAVERFLETTDAPDMVADLALLLLQRKLRAAVPLDFVWLFEIRGDGSGAIVFRHATERREVRRNWSDMDAGIALRLVESIRWEDVREELRASRKTSGGDACLARRAIA